MLTLLRNIFKSPRTYTVFQTNLGRWRIENEYKTNLKADYANNDHCSCSPMIQDNDCDDTTHRTDEYSPFLVEFVQDVRKQ
jgi:hypothetical protein